MYAGCRALCGRAGFTLRDGSDRELIIYAFELAL
jgi:hypothetical protein